MVLLESDAFLTGLTKLFQQTRGSGSVFLTMKKYNGRTKPHPKPRKGKTGKKGTATSTASSAAAKRTSPELEDHLCLLRAGNGKRHFSTVISVKEVTRFQMAYANVLKANLDGLKKRDKRTPATAATRRRKTALVSSPRRKRKASTH